MAEKVVARPSTSSLVAVPAALTLVITLVRLTGELLHWSPLLFNPAAGGGLALVGISWLPPLFGIWFGVKLARTGQGPSRVALGIGLVLLAIALLPLSGFTAAQLGVDPQSLRMLLVFAAASVVAAFVAWRAWPELGRTLLAYAFAARIPVALVMLFAILGDWGTHYDVPPTGGFPPMSPWAKWAWIGLLPQMTVWIAYTLATGGLFGIVAGAVARRRRPAAA